MFRNDGSVKSANIPVWSNRYQIKDYGLYRGVVRETLYTDAEFNDTGQGTPNEVTYNVMLIGGDRDGQLFSGARVMRNLGGFANFEETTLKHLQGLTGVDPTSLAAIADAPIRSIPQFNGDVVYIQFLAGDLQMPVIVGTAHHQKAETEATEDEGPRHRRKFNGIYTEITRDGEFTWSKDNGAHAAVSVNPSDPLYPLVNQFAAVPGQEQAVTVTLDNEYNLALTYLLGLNVSVKGVEDSFGFTTTSGAKVTITGAEVDAVVLGTALGTTVTVEGAAADSITLGTKVGTLVKVDGAGDTISLTGAAGDVLSVSASNGIQGATATSDTFSMKQGTIALTSGGQAMMELGTTVKLGNAGGDVVQLLAELCQTLSVEAPAGYGAPLVGSAAYAQLFAKFKLIGG